MSTARKLSGQDPNRDDDSFFSPNNAIDRRDNKVNSQYEKRGKTPNLGFVDAKDAFKR
jgi:hypothetical protein